MSVEIIFVNCVIDLCQPLVFVLSEVSGLKILKNKMVISAGIKEEATGAPVGDRHIKGDSIPIVPPKHALDDRFEVLGEDTMLSILKFVSNAPLEQVTTQPGLSELTDLLPGVSKMFQELSEHDSLWKPALLRQLQREPKLWTEGLLKLAENQKLWDPDFSDSETTVSFLERVRAALNAIAYKTIYKEVVSQHIRVTKPVFYMPGPLLLGGSYRVHLFEPRYRLMVAELLRDYPQEARQGGHTTAGGRPAPVFIHANRDPFGVASGACLVQMVRCTISPRDGTADIMLLPIAYVWLEKVWIRQNSGNLHYAQSVRMGQKATRDMHELIEQETRTTLIEGMADYGDYWTDDEDDLDDFDEDLDEDFGGAWE